MAFTAANWGQGRLLTGLTPTASLSGFVAVITKDNFPTTAFDNGSTSCLNGGGDWRFSTDIDGVNQLDCEIVTCVTHATPSSTEFIAKVRFSTYASGSEDVYAFWNKAGESQPDNGAAFGRDACNAGFLSSYSFQSDGTDSTGNGNDLTTTAGTPSYTAGKLGNALVLSGGSKSVGNTTVTTNTNTTIRVSAWIRPENLTANQYVTNNKKSGVSNKNVILCGYQDGYFNIYNSGYLTGTPEDTQVAATINTWQKITYVTNGTTLKGYKNGVEQISVTASLEANIDESHIGNSTGTDWFYGSIDEYTYSNIGINADFEKTEYDNQSDPSAFWTGGTVFVPSATGPTYSLSLSSGSYVYTGSAATLAANRKLSLSAGTYSYTGSSVDLAANRKLGLSSGSYTYTGNAATLKAGRKLSISSGSYAYTGSAVTLKAGRKLPIDAGSYTYTGSSVTLTYNAIGGPTYTLTLDAGSYALTGNAVGLAANRKLLLSAGSYSYTGQAVNLLAGRALALESGSYTYTGSSAALKANRSLSLDAGSYVYTGQSVTLSYSGLVVTVIDSYTINFKSDIITATFADDDHTIGFK